MTPDDWARIPWYARNKALDARRRRVARLSVVEHARLIEAVTQPDPDAAAHVAMLHHYTSTPRKRNA